MIKEFLTFLYRKFAVKSPKKIGAITYDQVMQSIGPLSPNVNTIYLSDSNYSTTTKEEAQKFVKSSQIDMDNFKNDAHDCDNYSYALNGYWSDSLESFAFGIAWSYEHAFNIMIDSDNKIWIVEPQTSEFIYIDDAKLNKLYFPIRLILI